MKNKLENYLSYSGYLLFDHPLSKQENPIKKTNDKDEQHIALIPTEKHLLYIKGKISTDNRSKEQIDCLFQSILDDFSSLGAICFFFSEKEVLDGGSFKSYIENRFFVRKDIQQRYKHQLKRKNKPLTKKEDGLYCPVQSSLFSWTLDDLITTKWQYPKEDIISRYSLNYLRRLNAIFSFFSSSFITKMENEWITKQKGYRTYFSILLLSTHCVSETEIKEALFTEIEELDIYEPDFSVHYFFESPFIALPEQAKLFTLCLSGENVNDKLLSLLFSLSQLGLLYVYAYPSHSQPSFYSKVYMNERFQKNSILSPIKTTVFYDCFKLYEYSEQALWNYNSYCTLLSKHKLKQLLQLFPLPFFTVKKENTKKDE